MKLSRRRLIQGGLSAGILAGIGFFKPKDIGQNHKAYFTKLSLSLKEAAFSHPTLVIDQTRLLHNISTLKQHINNNYAYRIVVKSLPSLPLLKVVSQQTGSQRFMVFNEHLALKTSEYFSESDLLFGKPIPTTGINKLLSSLSPEKGSAIQWLVDSPERLHQLKELSEQRQQILRLNFEIDIGLHRGGFSSEEQLGKALSFLRTHDLLRFDGFMGYEPHVVKLPGSASYHLSEAMFQYNSYIQTAQSILGNTMPKSPLWNTAGSPSYQLHSKIESTSRVANELSAGSCLVKPLDFDIPTLADHVPACFIACPILKTLEQTEIPGLTGLGELMAWWNPNLKRSLFTYGGNWKAQPVSPKGLTYNPLYGRSSNQEMLNASLSNPLHMDDWIFLRPTQSEAVFLEFGNIAVFDGESISDSWKVMS